MPHRDKEMQRIALTLTANSNTLSYVHYNITDIFWIRIHGKRKIHFELWKLYTYIKGDRAKDIVKKEGQKHSNSVANHGNVS